MDEASSIIYSHPSRLKKQSPQILEHNQKWPNPIQSLGSLFLGGNDYIIIIYIYVFIIIYENICWCSPAALQLTSQHGHDRILETTTRPKWISPRHGLTLSVCGSDAQGQELLVLLNSLACFIFISPLASQILRRDAQISTWPGGLKSGSHQHEIKGTPLFDL